LENADQRGLGHSPTSVLQRKISRCIYVCTACWYNVIDETKIVSSKTVISFFTKYVIKSLDSTSQNMLSFVNILEKI